MMHVEKFKRVYYKRTAPPVGAQRTGFVAFGSRGSRLAHPGTLEVGPGLIKFHNRKEDLTIRAKDVRGVSMISPLFTPMKWVRVEYLEEDLPTEAYFGLAVVPNPMTVVKLTERIQAVMPRG